KPSAYPKKSTLERINDVDQRTVLNVSAKAEDLNANPAQAGDILRIPSVLEKVEDTIALRGHVYRPGVQSFKDGMRLTDVISSVDQLKPGSDLRYGLIKRYLPPQQTLKVLSFRMDRALADPSSEYNIELKSKDEILVFGLYPRDQKLSPEYEEMAAQAEEFANSSAAFSDARITGLPLDYQTSSTDNAQSPLLDRDRAHSRTRFTVTEFEKEAAYWGRKWVIDEILEELRAQSEIGNPS
ncbi:hypothetical protein, partial [Oleiphilus sp. HI0066]